MDKVSREAAVRVGVDLAKRVIQVHAVDGAGRVLSARALARDRFIEWCVRLPAACVVAMETSSSAHYWARKLLTLGLERPDPLGRDDARRRLRPGPHQRQTPARLSTRHQRLPCTTLKTKTR